MIWGLRMILMRRRMIFDGVVAEGGWRRGGLVGFNGNVLEAAGEESSGPQSKVRRHRCHVQRSSKSGYPLALSCTRFIVLGSLP